MALLYGLLDFFLLVFFNALTGQELEVKMDINEIDIVIK